MAATTTSSESTRTIMILVSWAFLVSSLIEKAWLFGRKNVGTTDAP
jgi:hypothetical protein